MMLAAAGEKKFELTSQKSGLIRWKHENKPRFYKVAVAGLEFFKPPRGFQKSHFGENKPNLATLFVDYVFAMFVENIHETLDVC